MPKNPQQDEGPGPGVGILAIIVGTAILLALIYRDMREEHHDDFVESRRLARHGLAA